MTLQPWERVYNELQRKAEHIGYTPPLQIGSGNSQIFAFKRGRRDVLIVAFRDLGRKPDYSSPNRLWAEGLDLALEHQQKLASQGESLPPVIAVVMDNIRDAYVVVTMDDLLRLYLERLERPHAQGSRQFTFQVEYRDGHYFLIMPEGRVGQQLIHVNSVDSILLLLKALP